MWSDTGTERGAAADAHRVDTAQPGRDARTSRVAVEECRALACAHVVRNATPTSCHSENVPSPAGRPGPRTRRFRSAAGHAPQGFRSRNRDTHSWTRVRDVHPHSRGDPADQSVCSRDAGSSTDRGCPDGDGRHTCDHYSGARTGPWRYEARPRGAPQSPTLPDALLAMRKRPWPWPVRHGACRFVVGWRIPQAGEFRRYWTGAAVASGLALYRF